MENETSKEFTRVTLSTGQDDGSVETVSVATNSADLNADDMVLLLEKLLLGAGYHQNSIDRAFSG
jgi:hypothetical protein